MPDRAPFFSTNLTRFHDSATTEADHQPVVHRGIRQPMECAGDLHQSCHFEPQGPIRRSESLHQPLTAEF